ncbi:LysR substrate-binding domain-containing protein [Actinokineospora globicatena]
MLELMLMELRQLEYFIAVAEEGGFTRAAERERVAQPGISAQVRRLERELGQVLFDRSGRVVRLTQAGEALLPYARAAVGAVADARAAVDAVAGLLRGRVRVGMLTATPAGDLVRLLAGFHAAHPGVEVSLREDTSDRLVAGILAGAVDLAWVSVAGEVPAGIESVVLTEQPLVGVVAAGDPLAGRASVRVAGLRDRVLGCLPTGTGLRAALEGACAAAGFAPRVGFEASAPDVVVSLAAHGMGVAIVPAAVAEAHRGEIAVVRLTHPVPVGRVVLAWRSGDALSPAARALVNLVRNGPPG